MRGNLPEALASTSMLSVKSIHWNKSACEAASDVACGVHVLHVQG
jgi:hypothetical protein